MVFDQYRELVFAGSAFSDLDMDITVTMDQSSKLKFDATVWNLSRSTWSDIEKDSPVQIKAGWNNGPVGVLIRGVVNSTDRTVDNNDVKFTIKGVDESRKAVETVITDTFSNKDAGTIAASLAEEVGLAPVTVTVGQPIQGNWAVTSDQPVKYWLDELVEIAGEQTGVQWEWSAEEGELVFQPKQRTYREAPVLGWDTNLISIGPKTDGKHGEQTTKQQFESMMVPSIRQGAAVDVQGVDSVKGVWKVQQYEHITSSTGGEHHTTGVLIPTDTEYTRVN